jgi:hypothetical protein
MGPEDSLPCYDQGTKDEDRDGPWNVGFFRRLTNWHGW